MHWKSYLSLNNFGVQKCKTQQQNFEENKSFECSFLHIEVQVISNPSSRLEKHQTSKFLLINNFYDRFKNAHFLHFQVFFLNNHTKIIVCVLFYISILDQAQYSLISPFLTVILSRLVSTSGFNVKVQRSFKWHMTKIFLIL